MEEEEFAYQDEKQKQDSSVQDRGSMDSRRRRKMTQASRAESEHDAKMPHN